MEEQVETIKALQLPRPEETTKKLLTLSKPEPASGVTGSFIGMGIVGFCFGIGLMLAAKTVNNLEELIRR